MIHKIETIAGWPRGLLLVICSAFVLISPAAPAVEASGHGAVMGGSGILLASSATGKGLSVGRSNTKDRTTNAKLKLNVSLSLDHPEAYSSDPRVVRIRITNASNVPVPVSALVGIDFRLTKYHNDKVVGIREEFLCSFNAVDFEVVSPARELPKELKRKEQLEFKVNLSKGVWMDLASSLIDVETKGFARVDAGHYFIIAKVILWLGAGAENRMTLESNEIEVRT